MDTNKDGVWNLTEVEDFMTQYAKHLHRNMTAGWKATLKKGYDEINTGVSAKELELALSKHGADFNSFKQWIIANSEAKQGETVDMFELMEEVMEAIGNDSSDSSLNKD